MRWHRAMRILKPCGRAAKDFYKNDLAQRPEWSSSLGQTVQFTSSGYNKSFAFSGNVDKLNLFHALHDIIHHGRKVDTLLPNGHKEERNIKAYHSIEADVVLNGRSLTVEVIIREDNNGFLYYDHRSAAGLDRLLAFPTKDPDAKPVPKTNRGESNRGP